jgi:hypothetical protein
MVVGGGGECLVRKHVTSKCYFEVPALKRERYHAVDIMPAPASLIGRFPSTTDLATQFHWTGNVKFSSRSWMVDWRTFAARIRVRNPCYYCKARRDLYVIAQPHVSGTQIHTWRATSQSHTCTSPFLVSASRQPRRESTTSTFNSPIVHIQRHAIEYELVHVSP